MVKRKESRRDIPRVQEEVYKIGKPQKKYRPQTIDVINLQDEL